MRFFVEANHGTIIFTRMDIIIPFLIWQALAASLGIMEGAFFGAARGAVTQNLHRHFWPVRTIGAMGILYWMISQDAHWAIVVASAVCFALVFPFWHDGMYYVAYSWLNPEPYPRRFFDQSTTTSAEISFTFPIRLSLFVIGAGAIILITFL